MNLSTTVRIYNEFDLPFIYDSWYKTQKDIFPNRFIIDFKQKYHLYMAKLLERSVCLVSCLNDDDSEIISYMVFQSFRDNLVIHFAYTKVDARNTGKMTELLNAANIHDAPVIFTHPSKSERIMETMTKRYIFDPNIMELL